MRNVVSLRHLSAQRARSRAIGDVFSDPAGIFDGCKRPELARKVVDDTAFESRVTGFAFGILIGVIVGAAGAFVLHVDHLTKKAGG